MVVGRIKILHTILSICLIISYIVFELKHILIEMRGSNIWDFCKCVPLFFHVTYVVIKFMGRGAGLEKRSFHDSFSIIWLILSTIIFIRAFQKLLLCVSKKIVVLLCWYIIVRDWHSFCQDLIFMLASHGLPKLIILTNLLQLRLNLAVRLYQFILSKFALKCLIGVWQRRWDGYIRVLPMHHMIWRF